MNRRGHIPSVLMVFGALILVVFALYSFYNFSEGVNERRNQLRNLDHASDNQHLLVVRTIYGSVKTSVDFAKDSPDFKIAFKSKLKEVVQEYRSSGDYGNIFSKITMEDYSLELVAEKYVLTIKDIFYKISTEKNEAVRKGDLKIVFDKQEFVSVELN